MCKDTNIREWCNQDLLVDLKTFSCIYPKVLQTEINVAEIYLNYLKTINHTCLKHSISEYLHEIVIRKFTEILSMKLFAHITPCNEIACIRVSEKMHL